MTGLTGLAKLSKTEDGNEAPPETVEQAIKLPY